MKKTGFVVKNISKGREYFYLRKSYREENRPKNKNIFSFGERNSAISKLKEWSEDNNKIPDILIQMGYCSEDVLSWINQIKNK